MKRLYSMPDITLRHQAEKVVQSIKNNQAFFMQFGITNATITEFEALIEKANGMKEDKNYYLTNAEANIASKKLYKELSYKAKMLVAMLGFSLGKDSQIVGELSVREMSERKPDESLARAEILHARLTELASSPEGIPVSQAQLDDFAAAIAAFASSRKAYLALRTTRAPAADERCAAHNAVYSELVRLTALARAAALSQGKIVLAEQMKAVSPKYLSLQKRRKTIKEKKKGKKKDGKE